MTMRILSSLFIVVFTAIAVAAPATQPQHGGAAGQRAFDDLQKLYDKNGEPKIDDALRDLAGDAADARKAAGEYLLALLKQSWADERNGRAKWEALPFFGGGARSAARQFREQLAKQIEEVASVPEVLDAQLWLIANDRMPQNAEAGAKALTRNTSPALAEAYKKLLAPAHPNTGVVVTVVNDVAARKWTQLNPEITALANDHRQDVREAVTKGAAALGIKDLPAFDPLKALAGVPETQLRNISAMILTPVPKDAKFKQFTVKTERQGQEPWSRTFSAWLLSETPAEYHVLDLFAETRTCERANTTVADRTLEEEAQAILKVRANDSPERGERPREVLSARGGLTGQFQPTFVSLPEALIATWSLERGDRKTAAALILPCFDRARDSRWVSDATADMLAQVYHEQLLHAFTTDRDFPEVLRIGRHLGKEQFKDWQYYDRTRELAAQIEKRGADFKTFVLPTPDEWKALQQKLDRPAQVQYLAARIRLLNAFQWGQPGGVDFDAGQTRESSAELAKKRHKGATVTLNPIVELERMKLEVKDLPALLPSLDDENFVVAYGYWRDFHPGRNLYRVNYFVLNLINEAAAKELIPHAYLAADATRRKAMRDEADKWIAANLNLTRTQLLLENLKTHKDADTVVAAARELTRGKEMAALPILFDRITSNPEAKEREALIECCFHLAPEKSVEHARKWITEGGDASLWGGLILLLHGDKEKQEGLRPVKAALAKDTSDLRRHKQSYDILVKTGRPEAMDIAASVFLRVQKDTSTWDVEPFIHRLFLAGRKEALDFLLKGLDDTTVYGTRTATIDGKQVSISITRGDNLAENLGFLRTDKYEFPSSGSDKERAAERTKLKKWLEEQMALIRDGKPSAIKQEVSPFRFSSWMLDAPR
jgi:hypothetical protein